MPTTQANDEEVEEIYENIEELINLINSKENFIIMGDWNAIVGENTDDKLVNTDSGQGMNENRYKHQIKSCKAYPGADIDSDHNLVMIKSVLKFKKLKKPKNKGHKWNLCQLKQPGIRKLFKRKCKEKLETKSKSRIDDYNNIEHGWRRIKVSIVQSAEEILTREKLAPNCEWITTEIVQDIERRRLLKTKQIKKSQCTHVNDKEGNLLIDEIAIANRWKEYVEELYGEEENIDLLVETPTDGDFDSNADTRILKSEFEDSFQTMKKNKAPGPDELNTKLLQ
ncbi:Endonuclease/exonuclease/phosphatase [Cinara cedri]|uniref:Endonuclease/exonuclease/phosphatase n=1 Tax=Cinara cedri TaxID=506608 RepID=A0A5E4MBJ0_9HEMI|nr:Endonuclease/exonuclease/phosphatase [Cinara cedri]